MAILDLLKAIGIVLLVGGAIILLPFIIGVLALLMVTAVVGLVIGMLYLYFRDKRQST